MLLESEELGKNMGLSFEITKEVPNNQELKMLMELWESGNRDEQRKLAQALLELEI